MPRRTPRAIARAARLLKTASRLPPAHLAALARATAYVVGTKGALAVLPWREVSAAFDATPTREGDPDWRRAQVTLWAVDAVSRRLLRGKPCLTQALVAQKLLRGYGVNPDLRIGAALSAGGPFRAHAWLEHDGEVLIGGRDSASEYAPFVRVGAAPTGDPAPAPGAAASGAEGA